MDFNPLQLAVDRAKQCAGEWMWHRLTIVEQSDAIFRELRLIDAELARGRFALMEPSLLRHSRSRVTVRPD